MTVCSIILRGCTPLNRRIYAVLNLVCIVYVISISVTTTCVTLFYLVPDLCMDNYELFLLHRTMIGYLFILVTGHYITCIIEGLRSNPIVDSMNIKMADYHIRPTSENNLLLRRRLCNREREGIYNNCPDRTDTGGYCYPDGHCLFCKETVPARTHHCFLCERCVFKRDHHCFFMGVCIGKSNHKQFLYFTVSMATGTLYCLLLNAQYLQRHYDVTFSGPHSIVIVFFNTLFLLLQNVKLSTNFLGLFVLLYSCLGATIFSHVFLVKQLYNICNGQTTYEATLGITRYSHGGCIQNFKEVFNERWVLSMLVPGIHYIIDTT